MGVVESNVILGSECNSGVPKALALMLVLASTIFAVENGINLMQSHHLPAPSALVSC